MEYRKLKLLTETAEADSVKFKDMEQRKKDALFAMPSYLTEKPKNRATASIPTGFVVTKCDPGMARGIEAPRMRARGDHSSNTREPREATKRELRRKLEAMKGSISPLMYQAALRKLGGK